MTSQATFLGDQHRYLYEEGIEILLERFAEPRGGGLMAEVKVSSCREPNCGLLHQGRLNLVSTQSRATLVKALERRVKQGFFDDVDFDAIVQQASHRSLERWREGDPTVDLREVGVGERARWLLEPFVEEVGATILFGDGGTGKSTLAEVIAASYAAGHPVIGILWGEPRPVMILDWEADQYVHAERLKAICAGAGIDPVPPVFYRRQVASLMESVPTIKKEIAKLSVGLVVIDSLGAARGGDPESADTTIRLFNAARSLGVPWLGVDHVPKNAHDKSKPFGSTYTHNLARLTWGVQRAQEEAQNTAVVALVNHKANNGRLQPRMAFRLRFDTDDTDTLTSLTIESCDLRDVPEFVDRLPVKQRIVAHLRDGKMDVRSIADALQIGQDQARVRLNELARAGRVVRLGQEWGLPAHV